MIPCASALGGRGVLRYNTATPFTNVLSHNRMKHLQIAPTRVVLALVAALTVPHAGATLVNGDFENGLTGWTSFSTANGSGSAFTSLFDTTGSGTTSRAASLMVGQIQSQPGGVAAGGGLQQLFDFSGGAYALSVSLASWNFWTTSNAYAGVFSVALDGLQLGVFDFGSIDAQTIERGQINYSGSAAAGSHILSIQAVRPAPAASQARAPFQYIDNVTFTAANSVPEPGTLALLGLGAVALMASRKKRKA